MHLSVPLGIPTARRYGTSHAAIEMNGGATLVLTSTDDADALIAAACEAKRLLEPPVITDTGRTCPCCTDDPLNSDDCNCREDCGVTQCQAADPEPVITDSGRTCGQANPGSGAWCHRGGDHGVHEDTDGETWRTDGGEAGTIDPEYPKPGSRIPPELNYGMDGYVVGDCGHRVAGSEWRAGFRTCENCGINGDFEDDGEPEPSVTA